mgnify:CR=1 FL=1|jgi:hypothetical protein
MPRVTVLKMGWFRVRILVEDGFWSGERTVWRWRFARFLRNRGGVEVRYGRSLNNSNP